MRLAQALPSLLLTLAACSGEEPAPAPSAAASGEGMAPASEIDRAATAEHERIGAKARMMMTSDGFAYRVAGGTSTEEIGFGVDRVSVERIARQQFGEPSERSANEQCGAGPMEFSRYGPVQFNFQNGRLVGWSLRRGELATADGVRPGTTRFDDLRNERSAAMVEASSLDGEFSYAAADGGTIGGLVDEDGSIATLFAGDNCFFR